MPTTERSSAAIDILPNERVFIAGQTGSGKTFLAVEVLKAEARIVVFDVKNNLADKMNLVPGTRRNWEKFLRGKAGRLQIKAPIIDDADLLEYYEQMYKRAFMSANCIVYIDELLDVTRGSQIISPYFRALYTQGREPVYKDGKLVSGNIGIIACSQTPSRFPRFCITQSQHIFCFRMIDRDDRIRMGEHMGEAAREEIPDEHGFWYRDVIHMTEPVYYPSL